MTWEAGKKGFAPSGRRTTFRSQFWLKHPIAVLAQAVQAGVPEGCDLEFCGRPVTWDGCKEGISLPAGVARRDSPYQFWLSVAKTGIFLDFVSEVLHFGYATTKLPKQPGMVLGKLLGTPLGRSWGDPGDAGRPLGALLLLLLALLLNLLMLMFLLFQLFLLLLLLILWLFLLLLLLLLLLLFFVVPDSFSRFLRSCCSCGYYCSCCGCCCSCGCSCCCCCCC